MLISCSTVASLMPGMDLTVASCLSPSPRDISPALAIAIPLMKTVNLVPAQCFDNMAFNNEKDTKPVDDVYKNDDKTDVKTPLLRDHKIESLDETKLRDIKIEKRKSSAST